MSYSLRILFRTNTWLTLLSAIVLIVPTAQAQNKQSGQGLGRLLTTEFERSRMDEIRYTVAPPPKVYETGPAQLHIEGITERPGMPPGKRVTVWIDGRAYLESDLPKGLKLIRSKDGEVTGVESKVGKKQTEFARIGDMITRPQTLEEAQALEQQAALELAASKSANESLKEKVSNLTTSSVETVKDLGKNTLDKMNRTVQNLTNK